LLTNTLDELIREAENESETSIENIRALKELQLQHQQMFTEFKVKSQMKTKPNFSCLV